MAGLSSQVHVKIKVEPNLINWYEETLEEADISDDASDASDIENVSVDEFSESEYSSVSELSGSEDDENKTAFNTSVVVGETPKYVYGKNKLTWCTSEVKPMSGTKLANPVIKGKACELREESTPFSVWNSLFSDDILLEIVQWTNHKLDEISIPFKKLEAQRALDLVELKAFIGLLVYTSIFKSNHENIEELFATDGTGRDIFRAVMSQSRFCILLSALRFDNPTTRNIRKQEDPTAPISSVFTSFIQNCQDFYELGPSATLGEIPVSFRGRCHFKMYMPQKPCMYGIKLMCLTDSKTSYLYNAYIYCGKSSEGFGLLTLAEQQLSRPTQAVLRLAKPIFGSYRNLTANNRFTSMELIEILQQKQLTFVGALKKKQLDIPPSFLPKKQKKVGSTLYGFREEVIIVSHVEEQGKATILLSSMHDRIFNDPISKKPEIIEYYNRNKSGVDRVYEKCLKNTTSRRTRRWSLAIFLWLLDVSIINSYILHQGLKKHEEVQEQAVFAKTLAAELVQEHMRTRVTNPHISRDVRSSIRRILGRAEENVLWGNEDLILKKRKSCFLCPTGKRRMTKYLCVQCKHAICLQCSKPLCNSCAISSQSKQGAERF